MSKKKSDSVEKPKITLQTLAGYDRVSKDDCLKLLIDIFENKKRDQLIEFEKNNKLPLTYALARRYGYYFLYDVHEHAENIDKECMKLIFGLREGRHKRQPVAAFYTYAPRKHLARKIDYLFQSIYLLYKQNYNMVWDMFDDLGRNAWIRVFIEGCVNSDHKLGILYYILQTLNEHGISHRSFAFFKFMPTLQQVIIEPPVLKYWYYLLDEPFIVNLEKSFMYEMAKQCLSPKGQHVPDIDLLWMVQRVSGLTNMMKFSDDRAWLVIDPLHRVDEPDTAVHKFDTLYDVIKHIGLRSTAMGLKCTCPENAHTCPLNMDITNYFSMVQYVRQFRLGETVVSTMMFPNTHEPSFRIIKIQKYDRDQDDVEDIWRQPIGIERNPDIAITTILDHIKKSSAYEAETDNDAENIEKTRLKIREWIQEQIDLIDVEEKKSVQRQPPQPAQPIQKPKISQNDDTIVIQMPTTTTNTGSPSQTSQAPQASNPTDRKQAVRRPVKAPVLTVKKPIKTVRKKK